MAITYEDVNPTLIPNTVMQKMFLNGVHKTYKIEAVDGYVLHDRRADEKEYDPETGEEIGVVALRYRTGSTTVAANYDFNNVVSGMDGNTPVLKVGAYEFYAILESLVPADSVFGDNTQLPEIM